MARNTARLALALVSGVALAATLSACSPSVPTAEVGACTNLDDLEGEIFEFVTVDCSEPHDAQFVGKFELDHPEFPGEDTIHAEAEAGCAERFESFVGVPEEESELVFDYFAPDQELWDDANDREVLCVAFLVDGSTTTESFEGSGR